MGLVSRCSFGSYPWGFVGLSGAIYGGMISRGSVGVSEPASRPSLLQCFSRPLNWSTSGCRSLTGLAHQMFRDSNRDLKFVMEQGLKFHECEVCLIRYIVVLDCNKVHVWNLMLPCLMRAV